MTTQERSEYYVHRTKTMVSVPDYVTVISNTGTRREERTKQGYKYILSETKEPEEGWTFEGTVETAPFNETIHKIHIWPQNGHVVVMSWKPSVYGNEYRVRNLVFFNGKCIVQGRKWYQTYGRAEKRFNSDVRYTENYGEAYRAQDEDQESQRKREAQNTCPQCGCQG
jgi:hypothetical protein